MTKDEKKSANIKGQKIPGMRLFLIVLIDLISQGETVKCTLIEEKIADGIASFVYKSFEKVFERYDFDLDNIVKIDDYFKQWSGVADEQEFRKYCCKDVEGLQLIVKLALNDIF